MLFNLNSVKDEMREKHEAGFIVPYGVLLMIGFLISGNSMSLIHGLK